MQYTIVLVRPQGPTNIGMICRLVANLGAVDVRVVNPACEVLTPEARMYAHHAADVLKNARVFASVEAAVSDCHWVVGTTARRRRDTLPIFGPEEIAAEAQRRAATHVALVFGSEVNGLTEDELRVCSAGVTLQTPGPYPSYNLSQAVAITLYLATCPPAAKAVAAETTISHTEEARLVDTWLTTLDVTGFFRRTQRHRYAPKLQRLIGRMRLSPQDMHTLWGMLLHFRRE